MAQSSKIPEGLKIPDLSKIWSLKYRLHIIYITYVKVLASLGTYKDHIWSVIGPSVNYYNICPEFACIQNERLASIIPRSWTSNAFMIITTIYGSSTTTERTDSISSKCTSILEMCCLQLKSYLNK